MNHALVGALHCRYKRLGVLGCMGIGNMGTCDLLLRDGLIPGSSNK